MKNLKLTDALPWGVIDTQTGYIVARSSEGYLAADRCRTLNRKAGDGMYRREADGEWRKNLSDRFDILPWMG